MNRDLLKIAVDLSISDEDVQRGYLNAERLTRDPHKTPSVQDLRSSELRSGEVVFPSVELKLDRGFSFHFCSRSLSWFISHAVSSSGS